MIRETRSNQLMYLKVPLLAEKPTLVHGFFTRKGGVSGGIFAELNCGGWETAETAAIVDENRGRVAKAMGLAPTQLVSVQQVHGTAVVVVERAWGMDVRPKADAMVTKVPGIGLGVLTADCAPVLFADSEHQVVGAAHSGWKGALAGINEATVLAMEQLGAKRANIVAAIGPTIAQSSYEVDHTFGERFIHDDPNNERFFTAPDAQGHRCFNLPMYIWHRLTRAGIRTIDYLENDTYQEIDQFYSYRRATHVGEPDYGRQISVIALVA